MHLLHEARSIYHEYTANRSVKLNHVKHLKTSFKILLESDANFEPGYGANVTSKYYQSVTFDEKSVFPCIGNWWWFLHSKKLKINENVSKDTQESPNESYPNLTFVTADSFSHQNKVMEMIQVAIKNLIEMRVIFDIIFRFKNATHVISVMPVSVATVHEPSVNAGLYWDGKCNCMISIDEDADKFTKSRAWTSSKVPWISGNFLCPWSSSNWSISCAINQRCRKVYLTHLEVCKWTKISLRMSFDR